MRRQGLFELSAAERRELENVSKAGVARADHARRARVVLLSADGVSGVEIARRLGLSVGQVSRIRKRFRQARVEGLASRPRPGRRDHAVSREQRERIVSLALSPPPAGCARWSTRRIGAEVSLTSATVAKVLRAELRAGAERGATTTPARRERQRSEQRHSERTS